ncbi:hypothetical protein PENSPDRAFT_750011 [Peniophora sp. CONT]|nr:hypothetical protein PENSPDRAFT_750011 [Peniophora sp. CONT]
MQQDMIIDVETVDVWSPLVDQRFNAGPTATASSHLSSYDAELAFANRANVMAKKRRNMLVPACRIPTEILSTIFALAQSSWKPKCGRSGKKYTYDLGWTYVSHVCGYWRHVALRTPTLWNTIDCLSLPHRSAFSTYHRSKLLPLSLTFNNEGALYDDKALEHAAAPWLTPIVVSRIESLTISYCEVSEGNAIGRLFLRPMPHLAYLEVSLDSDPQGPVPRLSPRFCPEAHPEKVHLSGCLPHWTSGFLSPRLTHLNLHVYSLVDIGWLPFWDQFSLFLSSLNRLEELDLQDVFPTIIPRMHNNTVTLPPTFKRLKLGASHYNYLCLEFLLHLVLPSSCQVVVEMRNLTEPQPIENIADQLGRALSMLHRIHGQDTLPAEIVVSDRAIDLYKDELAQDSWTTDTINGSVMASQPATNMRSKLAQVQMFVSPDASEENTPDLKFTHHLFSLPLHNLSALSLSPHAIADLARTQSLMRLSAATGVRRLGIQIRGCAPLLNALRVREDMNGFDVFPSLEVIHLHMHPWDTQLPEFKSSVDIAAIMDLVVARKAGGVPLKAIVVQKRLEGWDTWNVIRSIQGPVHFVDFL